ncbi:MAG: tetratricopeptide repeat protein, partial [Candidatus Aegiribacteria sp.]|nr:tetratricopeptide repeat protein [Candidatus Aegiribacteria sp.]
MNPVILIILLSFLPENLQHWYFNCAGGDWGAAAENAGVIYAADSTDTEALAAMFIASALEYGLDAGAGCTAESFLPDSQSSLTLTALGVLLMSGTDSFLEDAENQLMESVRQDPNNVLAWYLLGTLKAECDSTESALHCFNEALSLDPDFQPAQLEAARLYRDNEDHDKAFDGFRMIMASESYSGLIALADCILLMERMGESEGLDSLENVLMRADSSAWVCLAQEQLSRRPDISLAAAEKAVQISVFGSFSADLARVFLELNEYGSAIYISLDLLNDAEADSTEILEILGAAYHGNHEIDRAKGIFLTLLDDDPLSTSALMYLGDIAEREARTEDAVDYFLRILEQDAFNSEARSRLRIIAGDSYDAESTTGTSKGFGASTAADLSIERGNRALLE